MRIRERGIGNLPFIAVLVLFVIAVALFFMTRDEADTLRAQKDKALSDLGAARGRSVKIEDAYKAFQEVMGISDAALDLTDEKVPAAKDVRAVARAYFAKVAADIAKASEATLQTKNYQVPAGGEKIEESPGEKVTIRMYVNASAKETATAKSILDPIARALEIAAKIAMENNAKYHGDKTAADTLNQQLKTTNEEISSSYRTDVAAKLAAAEGYKSELEKTRTSLEGLTTRFDANKAIQQNNEQKWAKQLRASELATSAWKGRAINEKVKKALAIREDPSDGHVLAVSSMGTVWLSVGTKHKTSRGTRFKIWRPGKGNVRQDVALVSVIKVERTRAEARILKRLGRISPTAGMNISNPFFDPKGTLKVYIYGDLRNYPTDIAARRLAASGAVVSRTLDDTVNVIVLGEPPRAGDEAVPEDEAEAAAAEKKQQVDRERRLTAVMNKAISIGAIVVTESVLADFIDY